MCKFHILREINFGDSRSTKSAILTQAQNFNFHDFLHSLKAEIDQIIKIQSLQTCKKTILELQGYQKLISYKI